VVQKRVRIASEAQLYASSFVTSLQLGA
jgi:hypothetical protein